MKRLLAALAFLPAVSLAQAPRDPASFMAAQSEAMKVFAAMDGAWRGTAWTLGPDGVKREFTQTERIGPFLGGTVKVIEGRGYAPDGNVRFNALGIVSYDPVARTYSMRSYALGRSGDFTFKPNDGGYVWEVPAGPGAIIRYTATIKDGTLHETGERIADDREPLRIFEMTLKRIGDTAWPAANPIPPS